MAYCLELVSYFVCIILTIKVMSIFMFPFSLKNNIRKAMDKISLSFKVDPSLKKSLEDLAEKENRSLSNYVITLLKKHLEDKGLNLHQDLKKSKI